MRYRAFKRAWWIKNPEWPDGREPGPGPIYKGSQKLFDTEEQARNFCQNWNKSNEAGFLSVKYEFEEVR